MLHRIILKENRRFSLLSLREMCLIKVITTLCNHPQLRRLILECKFHDGVETSMKLHLRNGKEWEAVEKKAEELVSQLCLPGLLQKKVLNYLWPISYRMTLWKSVYAPRINNSYLNHFYWTDQGRINNTRTIRLIIRNRNIFVCDRFALACSVCLYDLFPIWLEMSLQARAYLYRERYDKIYPLIRFWSDACEVSRCVHYPFLDNAIKCASRIGLLEAVKCLFSISPKYEIAFMTSLCSEELLHKLRSGNLLEEDENDIQYFVFSKMSDEEQRLTCECFADTTLSLLLHSYKYELCLQLMVGRLESASLEDIARCLKIIFYTYHLETNGVEDCRVLFMDIWRKIPDCMKRDRTLGFVSVTILFTLIRDNFPFLFKAGAFEKISDDFEFIDTDKPEHFHEGKWDLLHFIIKEGITISFLKKRRKRILSLKGSLFHEGTFKDLLTLIRKVQSKT